MQPAEIPAPTLLSYAVPFWITLHLLINAAPYWATGHSTELRCTLAALRSIELSCTLSYTAPPLWASSPQLSYLHLTWATLNPTELRWTLLSYAVPYWATQHHVSYTTAYLSYLQYPYLYAILSNVGLSGTGISVPQSDTGMLRYRTEMLDARMPMPTASASMPMPSYAFSQVTFEACTFRMMVFGYDYFFDRTKQIVHDIVYKHV